MPNGHGSRARTRDSFSRPFRKHGYIPISTYLRTYKLGDYVDIRVNSAVMKAGPAASGQLGPREELTRAAGHSCMLKLYIHPAPSLLWTGCASGSRMLQWLSLLPTYPSFHSKGHKAASAQGHYIF